jgi:beta-glucosidase-like glycosyl hydrolase
MAHYGTVGFGEVSIKTMLGATPIATVRARNRFQSAIMNSSRLHLPISFSQEALHSGAYYDTISGSVATGGLWSDSLPFLIGSAIAEEARASGVNVDFAPVAQLWTDDRFGRFTESFSQDPPSRATCPGP